MYADPRLPVADDSEGYGEGPDAGGDSVIVMLTRRNS